MSSNRSKDSGIINCYSRVVKISDAKTDERINLALKEYAKLANPSTYPHVFKEIEQYFLELCDVIPITLNDNDMSLFKAVVIGRHFECKENKAPNFSDHTYEEIVKWHKEKNDLFNAALFASPKQYGLKLHGYRLPYTNRNEAFYDEAYPDLMKDTDQIVKRAKINDICFFFEETTEEYYFTCAGCSLMYKVIIFIGISEDDIKKHNQRFVTYINAMVQMGYLPDLIRS
jgi:hypothetical protein